MLKRFDVIVAGGGMVGAAAAASFAQQGKSVCVLEAASEPAAILADDAVRPRVVAINSASQALLKKLDVWEQLLSWRATAYQHMYVWDGGGFGKIEFDATEAGIPELGHIIENHLIERALYERCMALSERVSWMANTPIQDYFADQESVVVTLENGHILSAQLLVGADGALSQVRAAGDFGWQQHAYGQRGIVAMITSNRPHQQEAWQVFHDSGVLAFLPLHNGSYSIVWSVSDGHADTLLAMTDAEFSQALTSAMDARPGVILKVGKRFSFPLSGAQAGRYVRPRAVLVGDAAHLVHPLAGQGVNLGFADVSSLCGIIQASQRPLGSSLLLRRYERSRAGENLAMRRLMEGFQHLFLNRNPVLGFARGLGLDLADQITLLKNEMMRVAIGNYQ